MVMTPARFFVLMTALFASLASYFVPRMEASGDEPHYLVMAQSLWREHDLDLRDNYAREDWREFRSGPTEPHYAAPRKDGRPFPGHAPGLPFILAPVYALGGRLGCAIVLGLMVAAVGAIALVAVAISFWYSGYNSNRIHSRLGFWAVVGEFDTKLTELLRGDFGRCTHH